MCHLTLFYENSHLRMHVNNLEVNNPLNFRGFYKTGY